MFERKDNLSGDDYFMGIAKLTALRSKDPGTRVGACIVDPNKIIISTGYNGFPRGIPDAEYNWSREDLGLGTKYDFVVHAELNAILNSGARSLEGATLYTSLLPCSECAKAIIQTGIKTVVYEIDEATGDFHFDLTKRMFNDVVINLIQHKFKDSITL